MPRDADKYGEEIKEMYRKEGLTPPEGKGLHTKAFHGCVISYLKKGMSYGEGAKRCMGALGEKAVNPSHRRQEDYMEQFDEMLGKYRVTVNDDGTRNIHDVPIFELGTFKSKDGKAYDDEWFNSAKKTHEAMKQDNGYLPTFHPGHNKDDGTELPAMGLFDNLKKAGKMVLADLVRIGQDSWNMLREGKYPYRSIEATHGENGRILSLAMLGSRPPAVKTPPLYAGELPEGAFVDTFSIVVDESADRLEYAVIDTVKTEAKKEAVSMEKEKIEADVAASEADAGKEKLLEKIDANEKAKMAEQIKALESQLANVQDVMAKSELARKEAAVDLFIEKQNAAGKLTKAQIDYDGVENGLALRKLVMSFSDEQREGFEAFVAKMEPVAHFKQEAKSGDETAKEAESKKDVMELFNEKVAAHMADKKQGVKIAQREVLAAMEPADREAVEAAMLAD